MNKDLFEKYEIPLPTDYESFVSACRAFDKVGIHGLTADYYYDDTCMETLQGQSASELSSVDGRKWRTAYKMCIRDSSITMPEIIDALAAYDISAERKSLYNDIENLRGIRLSLVFPKRGSFS